jgi:maltose O-acetyltransferase
MTEKEKMLAGLPYEAWDEQLLNERMNAKEICHKFNQYDPSKREERMALLAGLLAMKGKAYMEPHFYCDHGYNIELGNNFYSNHHLTILDVCKVSIGDNVMLGPHVMISTATHPIDPIERRDTEFGKPIIIGNDVWIGGNVSILPGVTIGHNCVIGAGSVVVQNMPNNAIAAGNPCSVKKTI